MFPLLLFSGFVTLTLCVSRQYYFVNESMTWTEAQSYCRDKYTDLVTIENDQETIQLLNTVNDYNSIDLAWIGLYDDLNSWKWTLEDRDFFRPGEKEFRNWFKVESVNYGGQSLCVYMSNGIWYPRHCYNTLPFICYDGRVNASANYVGVYQNKNWTEAQSYCREHHTDLVSIRNETENQKIRYLLQNFGHSWIGLYRTRSWSDQSNSTFSNWRTREPDNNGNSQYCTAVSFSDSGKWTDENCNYQFPFLCYSALASSRQYHFISESRSWSEAQRYCRENYTDLATIDNMEEMNSVINTVNGRYRGSAWIGLYDDLNSWRWSLEDNDFYQEGEREFRNWYHEPNNNGGNDLCVYMDTTEGTWFDESCNNILSSVCYDGRDNATQKYITITEEKTWTEALSYCREHYTDLANVRNLTENQKIINRTGRRVWIGLYRNRIWSNGQMTKYQNWRPEMTSSDVQKRAVDSKNSVQLCTAVLLSHVCQWTNENCLSIKPFFCYSKICSNSSCSPHQYHFISEPKSWFEAQRYCRENYTDLATIDNMEEMYSLYKSVRGIYQSSAWIGLYDDPNSWRWSLENTELGGGFKNWFVSQPMNLNGKSLCVSMSYNSGIWSENVCSSTLPFICYDGRQNASGRYVYVEDYKNWTEAQRYCREHHTDLVSIRNETENQNIQYLFHSYAAWIGLYRTRSWSDQTNSTFSNWKTGEPDNAGKSQYCTAVSFNDSGKWTDENCNYQFPFLCYSDIGKVNKALTSSRQYHFISENKSWSEAQRYCRENYTDLATIDNMEEMNSVINTVNGSYNGSVWIGLYDDLNSWRWSLEDNDFYQEGEREFRNWYHEPNNNGGNDLCVSMNATAGTWFDESCDRLLEFVCYDGSGNASQKYVLVAQNRTWTEAQRYCREFYTDLASVRNETERQQIRGISYTDGLKDYKKIKLWIGLHRNKLWSDQSNSSFTYWLQRTHDNAAQPDGLNLNGQANDQQCTAVSLGSLGHWTDERCSDSLPFFCYSEKYVMGLRVKFSSQRILSESQIQEWVQDQLQQELIRLGFHGNLTMHLRNYRKIGVSYRKVIA